MCLRLAGSIDIITKIIFHPDTNNSNPKAYLRLVNFTTRDFEADSFVRFGSNKKILPGFIRRLDTLFVC